MTGVQKAQLGLVEDLHERHVGHNSGRYAQRSGQDTAGGQLDEGGEEDHRRAEGRGGSRAAYQGEGDADVGIFDGHICVAATIQATAVGGGGADMCDLSFRDRATDGFNSIAFGFCVFL